MIDWALKNLPSDSDNESNLWCIWDVERSGGFGVSMSFDESSVGGFVLVVVPFSVGVSNLSSGSSVGFGLGS